MRIFAKFILITCSFFFGFVVFERIANGIDDHFVISILAIIMGCILVHEHLGREMEMNELDDTILKNIKNMKNEEKKKAKN